jgi:NADPH2:quinone reductase
VKAVLCKAYGPPELLAVEDVPPPAPGPGDVLISVAAASLNFPDVLMIENKYQTRPPLPFSPGCEAAGVVKDVGREVTHVKRGDRVMAVTGHGAFAEEIVVPAARAVPIPGGMDDVTAASFLFTYGTAHYALCDRGRLLAGENLLVLGAAGGVGLAAIEVGKAVGARTIACASTDDKLALCRAHGADETINYAAANLRDEIKRLAGEHGVDVVCDPVGGPYTEPALRSTAWNGRFLVVGFAAGEIPKIALNLPLLKGCSIVGVSWGAFTRREPARYAASVRQICQWYGGGRLKPHIDRTFPLERAAEALRLMATRGARGKIVLIVGAQAGRNNPPTSGPPQPASSGAIDD